MDELTPRQLDFLKYYNDPKSETFSNALQSALRAGYSQNYADSLLSKGLTWLDENTSRRKRMLEKAETKLETLLESEDEKIVADISKHVTKTLGREYYSEKSEVEHKGNITIKQTKYGDIDTPPIQAEGVPDSIPESNPEPEV